MGAVEFVELVLGLSAESRLAALYMAKEGPRTNNPPGMTRATTHETTDSLRRSVLRNSRGSFEEVTL